MNSIYTRTEALLGSLAMEKIKRSKVIVFGAGGVGGFAIEALARSGIGEIAVVDFDTIDISNLNRQVLTLEKNVGILKALAAIERIGDINKEIKAVYYSKKVTAENIEEFNIQDYDYVIDAIDDVTAKLSIILNAKQKGIPIISSMGMGNKLKPEKLVIADIKKTHTCPLARTIRKGLREAGVSEGLKVVFSTEEPITRGLDLGNKIVPASSVFVPGSAGLLLASETIKELINM